MHLFRHCEPSWLVNGHTTSSSASPPKEPEPAVVAFGGIACGDDCCEGQRKVQAFEYVGINRGPAHSKLCLIKTMTRGLGP